MCFFNFIKQHHAVRAAAHGLGQLAAFLVADIARRRAQQAGDGVLLHIFRHIKAQQGFFTAKPALGQCAGQLRFAYAGRPQKQHGPDGPPGLPQAGAAAADGRSYGSHGGRLADDLGA